MHRSRTEQNFTKILWLVCLTAPIAAPKTLFQFGLPNDGAYPAGMIEKDGVLYGVTNGGGTAGFGTVYSLAPASGGQRTETILWNFAGGRDGADPNGDLIVDARGVLYGTTNKGGTKHLGTIFALIPPASSGGAWRKTVIYNFTGSLDGKGRWSNLSIASGGVLYGATSAGGSANYGAVFSLTPPSSGHRPWTYAVIYSFTDGSDGAVPNGSLAVGGDGTIYGTTVNGGSGSCMQGSITGCGTIFSLAPPALPGGSWTETPLYFFAAVGSSSPNPSGLVLGGGGVLYGVAMGGGNGNGSVFSLTPPASAGGAWTEADLYLFQGNADGAGPSGTLAIASDGTMYGTIVYANERHYQGVFSLSPPASPGGVWTESVIYIPNAFGYFGGLIIDSSGTLFTTVTLASAGPLGEAISLKPPKSAGGSWISATLHRFSGGAAGKQPTGGVILFDSLYGLTRTGGAFDAGAVYWLPAVVKDEGAQAMLLYSFGSGSDGANPAGRLLPGAKHDTLFYGVTENGGASGFGTVFSLQRPKVKSPSWTEAVIYSFAGGSDGANPAAGLVSYKGSLIGTTQNGGTGGDGAVFSLSPPVAAGGVWTKATLYDFSGSDGANPMAELILFKDVLYGTTYSGGASNNGTVFSLAPSASGGGWKETVLYSFAGGSDGANPAEKLTEWQTLLYGTTLNGGPANAGTVYSLTPMGGFLTWTESVIYAFKGKKDGANPQTALVAAKLSAGHAGLLGTATGGGKSGGGTLFSLAPPASEGGAWTQTVLSDFGAHSDGASPSGGLAWIARKDYGEIYGSTSSGGAGGGGTVYDKGIGFH